MSQSGVERNQEIRDARLYADVRTFEQKMSDLLSQPDNMRNFMIALAVSFFVVPILIPFLFPVAGIAWLWFKWQQREFRMPVRYPEYLGRIDLSERDDNAGIRNGRGLEYMGVERKGRTVKDTLEIWASDSDVRTHRIIFGTTGAGKTQALLSILFNPLCWGSGFSMTDGKAQVDVTANIFVMCWLFWREDDMLVLNYMRGGQDRFREMINKPQVGKRKSRVSNTWNPFATANHDTVSQIIDSIMEKATGEGAQWQGKAINMKNALVQTIAYFRAAGTMLMSVGTIREQMSLDNIIKLALRNDLPPQAAAAIRSYLSSGLPGFNWQSAKKGKAQEPDTYLQHGYLTGQFTRTLGLMSDTYNDIFGDEIPEYDTSDAVLNNRISMTMIPTLEKGVEEAGNLGKMQVASAKMMMAENLGYELEGTYEDIVENRATNTHRPYYLVMDELGYYFAPGVDLMFAQGRSLNIALIAAGQDFQSMAKNYKSEVETMIANTRFKIAMKIEDPKETFEIFEKAAGEGAVARIGGYEIKESSGDFDLSSGVNYKTANNSSIEMAKRVGLQELKKLGFGDGVFLSGEKVIRFRGFNLFMHLKFDKKKINIRINKFLPIAAPESFSVIAGICEPVSNSGESVAKRLMLMLQSPVQPEWGRVPVALISMARVADLALCDAADLMDEKPNTPAARRGIVLFMAAIRAIEKAEAGLKTETFDDEGKSASGGGQSNKVSPEGNKKPIQSKKESSGFEWLENPPIKINDKSSVENNEDQDFDDENFGTNLLQKNEDDKEKISVSMSSETRKTVANIIENLSGGPEAISTGDIEREIEITENMINEACEFKESGEGSKDDPAAVSDPDDVMDVLNSITNQLKGA
jgi:intracellular multiplication protein IcmO